MSIRHQHLIALLLIAVMSVTGCVPHTDGVALPVQAPAAATPATSASDFDWDVLTARLEELRELGEQTTAEPETSSAETDASTENEPPKTPPPVTKVDCYQRFMEVFFKETERRWPQWRGEVQQMIADMNAARKSRMNVPDSSKLDRRLTELSQRGDQYTQRQQEALAEAKRLLDEYVVAVEGVDKVVNDLDEPLHRLSSKIEEAIADVEALPRDKIDEAAAQKKIAAMMAPSGSVGSALALLRDEGSRQTERVGLVRSAIEAAFAKRDEFYDAIARVLELVPDPVLIAELKTFKEKDEKYWTDTKIALSLAFPLLGLIFLLLSAFGGGKGKGKGKSGNDESGKQDKGSDKKGEDQGSGSGGEAKEPFALPEGAKALKIKSPDDGEHLFQFFTDANGNKFFRIFIFRAESNVVTLKFDVHVYDGFETFTSQLNELTLEGINVISPTNPFPITATFVRPGNKKYFVHWANEAAIPTLLGGDDNHPIKLDDDEEPLPIDPSSEGEHAYRFSKKDGKNYFLLALNKDPDTVLRLPFNLNDNHIEVGLQQRTLRAPRILDLGDFANPFPLRIELVGCSDGVVRHVRWDDANEPVLSEN